MTKRPRRQRKGDRLTNPGATPTQVQIDYTLAPFDRLAIEMENKWGIDRLPELVSVDTAEKYGRTIGRLNAAIDADDPAEANRLAQSAMRGLQAMDAEATAAGHDQMPAEFWEYDLDGFKFAVMPDNARWPEIKKRRPDLVLFTMREAALALRQMNASGIIAATKDAFPGAEVQKVTPIKDPGSKFWNGGGDELPF